MHWSAAYVGIPFAWNGYSRDGASCWGLVWLVQHEVFGRTLPKHDEAVASVEAGNVEDFRIWRSQIKSVPVALDEAAAGDILHMWGGTRKQPLHVATHAGVIDGFASVLNIEASVESSIVKLQHPRVRSRIIQAYRLV